MINRRAALSLLLLLAACDAKLSAEREMREKFANTDCYISTKQYEPYKKWHSRADCPDLAMESTADTFSKKPYPPLCVHTKPDGLYDGNGFKYEHPHCPKCAY